MLEEMADAIEGKPITVKLTPDVVSLAFLERVRSASESRRFSAVHVDSFATLFRESDPLKAPLAKEIATGFRSGRTER
jgi:hypothetical protein